MSDLPAVAQAQLPAHLQGVVGQEVFDELSGGVQSGFPVISYKGKVWRVRKSGEEQVHVNEEGEAMPSLELVLLRSNERPSKTYYKGAYSEGDQGKPDCWSSDGLRPDSTVPTPVSQLCQNCPMNQWGSKITDQGKQTRACADVRRVAVAMGYQVAEVAAGQRKVGDVDVLLLRVPAASLNNLKDYADKVLKPKGIPYFVLITKVGFDAEVAYPKLTFKGLRFLNEQEFAAASALRESDEAKRVLNESAEYADAGTTGADGQAGAASTQAAPEATAPAPAKAKPQPVEETAVEAEQTAAQAEVVDDIAPAPPPTQPAAPSPQIVPVSQEVAPSTGPSLEPKAPAAPPAAPAAAPATDDDFNAMLDSILD